MRSMKMSKQFVKISSVRIIFVESIRACDFLLAFFMTNTKSLWHERHDDAVCINGIFSMVLCKGIPRFVNETMWSKPAEHTLFKRKYSTRAGGHWCILMKRSLIKTTVVQIPHGTVAIGKIIPDLIDHLDPILTNLRGKVNVSDNHIEGSSSERYSWVVYAM